MENTEVRRSQREFAFHGKYNGQDVVFAYEFDKLIAAQHHQALAIAQFQVDLFSRGVRGLQQLEVAGGADWILRMCAHLTVEENADGSLVKYDRTKVNRAFMFHENLEGNPYERQVAVVSDFLLKHDKQEIELLLLSRDAVQLAALVQGQTQSETSSAPNESTADFSSPENLTEGS